MRNPLLQAALAALARGWSFVPINAGGPYDKRPHFALLTTGHFKQRDGRNVPSWEALQTQPPHEEHALEWFSDPRGKGLALITGEVSRVVVLDFDGVDGEQLVAQWNVRPHVRTGSGGYHLYLPHPGWRVKTIAGKSTAGRGERVTLGGAYPGLDVRADGGMSVLPPSRNQKGPYLQLRSFEDLASTTELPLDLVSLLGLDVPPAPKAPPASFAPLALQASEVRVDALTLLEHALIRQQAGDGRNQSGFWLACQLRDNGYAPSEARDVMLRFVDHVPDTNTKGQREPYTQGDALNSLHSALRQDARDPWQIRTKRVTSPKEKSVLERLEDVWENLTVEQRKQAARHVMVSWLRDKHDEEILTYFHLHGHDARADLTSVRAELERNVRLPGLNRLAALLTRWQAPSR